MQDQTWASKRALPREDGRRPIPKVELMDDGKYSAVNAMFDMKKLKEVTIPSGGTSANPMIRDDVTLADVRNTPDLRLRRATLDQFLKNRERADVKRGERTPAIVNFLDLPMSGRPSFHLPIKALDMFPNLQSHFDPRHAFASEVPHADFQWALSASGGAISKTHMDSGGFGTQVRIVNGFKDWFLAFPNSTRPDLCVVNGVEEKKANAAVKLRRELVRLEQKTDTPDDEKVKPFANRPRGRKVEGETYLPYVSVNDGFVNGAMD